MFENTNLQIANTFLSEKKILPFLTTAPLSYLLIPAYYTGKREQFVTFKGFRY